MSGSPSLIPQRHLKVLDHKNLIKDIGSKAVLCSDSKGLDKYRQEREKQLKLEKVIKDTDQLRSDMSEVKNLLRKLLEKNNIE
jgi:hypothetical protein